MSSREHEVLEAVERRRRLKPKLKDERVTLAHGAGGKATQVLVEALFVDRFGTPAGDAAVFEQNDTRLAITTDSFVVKPLFFPGGDIGELAVNGSVNDLAMSGARPLQLTAGFIIEEGFPTDELRRIAESMAEAAQRADVKIAAGDTKVVERGKADGVYVNTAGIGVLERPLELSPARVERGDRVLISGTIGDHGMAVMIARGELELEVELESDTAALGGLVSALLDTVDGVRWLRDPTRGGMATVLNELALEADLAERLDEHLGCLAASAVSECHPLVCQLRLQPAAALDRLEDFMLARAHG